MRPLFLGAVGFAALPGVGEALALSPGQVRDDDTIIILYPLRAHTLTDDDPRATCTRIAAIISITTAATTIPAPICARVTATAMTPPMICAATDAPLSAIGRRR